MWVYAFSNRFGCVAGPDHDGSIVNLYGVRENELVTLAWTWNSERKGNKKWRILEAVVGRDPLL